MSSRPAAWKAFWHRLVHLLTLKPKPAGKGICSKSCPAFNLLSSWDLCPLLSHVGLAFLLFHQRHPVGLTAASRASHPGDEIRNPCFPTLTSRQVLNSWETEENWAQQTLEGICQISPKKPFPDRTVPRKPLDQTTFQQPAQFPCGSLGGFCLSVARPVKVKLRGHPASPEGRDGNTGCWCHHPNNLGSEYCSFHGADLSRLCLKHAIRHSGIKNQ